MLIVNWMRVGYHHSVGVKMGVPVQERTLDNEKIYRQNQYKNEFSISPDELQTAIIFSKSKNIEIGFIVKIAISLLFGIRGQHIEIEHMKQIFVCIDRKNQ
jgi:hypothetical protein